LGQVNRAPKTVKRRKATNGKNGKKRKGIGGLCGTAKKGKKAFPPQKKIVKPETGREEAPSGSDTKKKRKRLKESGGQ